MKHDPNKRRVVITGMGTINPIANSVDEFWEKLPKGISGVKKIRNFDMGDFPVQIAGQVDIPDVSPYFKNKKIAEHIDRYSVMGTIASVQAFRDSGLDVEKAPNRYGVIMANGAGGAQAYWDNVTRIHENDGELTVASPYWVVAAIPSTGSAYFALENNFQGPNFSISSACSSSAHSIGTSIMLIRSGMADAMMAGGAEAVATKMGVTAFGVIGVLSQRNDEPEKASRPFDVDRDGFVMAEGGSMLCLEELEHAKKRGAKIYAEITGVGFSCDAHSLVSPHPEGQGAALAINDALNDAGLNSDEIDLVNAHGTSTKVGDLFEAVTIKRVFGDDYGRKIPVHSTKSITGHMIGATSSTEVIASVLAIQKGVIHENINLENQDPEIDINVVKEPIEKKTKHVLSNSFAFGGQNAALIISEYDGS